MARFATFTAVPTTCRVPAYNWGPARGWRRPSRWWPHFRITAEIAQLLQERNWSQAADVILLDPEERDGYVRKWLPPGFPPLRHIGYAVQWFGLAAGVGGDLLRDQYPKGCGMTPTPPEVRRSRRFLIGVALMFFAPLALSFYLYYGGTWHPGGHVNRGELVQPARPLPAVGVAVDGIRSNRSKISDAQMDLFLRAARHLR